MTNFAMTEILISGLPHGSFGYWIIGDRNLFGAWDLEIGILP
jgi:hypothetical protein